MENSYTISRDYVSIHIGVPKDFLVPIYEERESFYAYIRDRLEARLWSSELQRITTSPDIKSVLFDIRVAGSKTELELQSYADHTTKILEDCVFGYFI